MKFIKALSFSLLMLSGSVTLLGSNIVRSVVSISETPAKTVIIKAGGAANANTFFSTTKAVSFEVYKAGSADELAAMISKIKAHEGVEIVITGKTTGDYTNVNVSLKEVKDKAYWIGLFKAAGLGHVKINNNPVTDVEKM